MRLFDLHCDTLFECVKHNYSIYQNPGQLDIVRGAIYSPWYQCFAAWVRDKTPPASAAAQIEAQLQQAQQLEWKYPAHFHILRSFTELQYPTSTACTAILTVENGGVAAGEDVLPDSWIHHDVKMITLTWNGINRWASGCDGDPTAGLTPAGKAAVQRMEAAGILPDAAHLNRRGFWELVDCTRRPFVVSHTAAAALHPISRNLTDAQFLAVQQRGGLVGLDFCPEHLGSPTVERLIAHLEQFLSLGGEQTVALGCDFDGITLPPEWEGMRILETLYDRLRQRNYAESLIDALFFGNAYRFFTTID